MAEETMRVFCPYCKNYHVYLPGEVITSGHYRAELRAEDENPMFAVLAELPPWQYVFCKGSLRHIIIL